MHKIIILFLSSTERFFSTTDRFCVSLFAASVQVFLFASVKIFSIMPTETWLPQRPKYTLTES